MTHEKTNETSETREVDAMDDGRAREWCMRHTHARRDARTHTRTHEHHGEDFFQNVSRESARCARPRREFRLDRHRARGDVHHLQRHGHRHRVRGDEHDRAERVFRPSNPCVSGTQTVKAGVDSITVSWTVASGDSVDAKLCYTDIASKPWRKFKDNVKKNKKCKQTAVEKANIAVGETGSSVTIPVELNIAPTTYTIQILSKDSTGGYTSYANDACAFKVESYERLPTNLVGTMSFFIAFSIVVATAGTWYDYKKQSAAAAAWGS